MASSSSPSVWCTSFKHVSLYRHSAFQFPKEVKRFSVARRFFAASSKARQPAWWNKPCIPVAAHSAVFFGHVFCSPGEYRVSSKPSSHAGRKTPLNTVTPQNCGYNGKTAQAGPSPSAQPPAQGHAPSSRRSGAERRISGYLPDTGCAGLMGRATDDLRDAYGREIHDRVLAPP